GDARYLAAAYALVALVFGAVYIAVTPPAGVGDEPMHFERIYEVSSGQLLGAVGLPKGDAAFIDQAYDKLRSRTPYRDKDLSALRSIATDNSAENAYRNPLRKVMRIHHPVAYAPYAPAIALRSGLDLSPYQYLISLRLSNLVISIAMVAFAISIAPLGRAPLALLALTPTTLSYFGGVNIDGFLVGASFLFIAVVSRLLLTKSGEASRRINTQTSLLLSALLFFIGSIKAPYVAIGLLALAGRRAQYELPGGRAAAAAIILTPALVSALTWAFVVKTMMLEGLSYSTDGGDLVNSSAQMAHLFGRPSEVFSVFSRTMINADFLSGTLLEMVGQLVWSATWTPFLINAIVLFSLCMLIFGQEAPVGQNAFTVSFPPLFRPVSALVFLAVTSATLFFLYLQWTGVGAEKIAGFQGRYVIPVFPLVIFAVPKVLSVVPRGGGAGLSALLMGAAALYGGYGTLSSYFYGM
ncbi:MAG: DUF2142 domain-containing protein, partial [Pseudomonadota bacterium]